MLEYGIWCLNLALQVICCALKTNRKWLRCLASLLEYTISDGTVGTNIGWWLARVHMVQQFISSCSPWHCITKPLKLRPLHRYCTRTSKKSSAKFFWLLKRFPSRPGGFLSVSKELRVLWSSPYLSRLWQLGLNVSRRTAKSPMNFTAQRSPCLFRICKTANWSSLQSQVCLWAGGLSVCFSQREDRFEASLRRDGHSLHDAFCSAFFVKAKEMRKCLENRKKSRLKNLLKCLVWSPCVSFCHLRLGIYFAAFLFWLGITLRLDQARKASFFKAALVLFVFLRHPTHVTWCI